MGNFSRQHPESRNSFTLETKPTSKPGMYYKNFKVGKHVHRYKVHLVLNQPWLPQRGSSKILLQINGSIFFWFFSVDQPTGTTSWTFTTLPSLGQRKKAEIWTINRNLCYNVIWTYMYAYHNATRLYESCDIVHITDIKSIHLSTLADIHNMTIIG